MAIIKHEYNYEQRKEALATMTTAQKVSECEDIISYIAYLLAGTEYFAYKILALMRRVPDFKIDTLGVSTREEGGEITLLYNPDFLLLLDLDERRFVLNHEVLHCSLHHITLTVPPDKAHAGLFNTAHDLAINSMLKEMTRCKVPKYYEDVVVDGKVVAKKGDDLGLFPKNKPFEFDDYLSPQNYLYLLKKKFPPQSESEEECPVHGAGGGGSPSPSSGSGEPEDKDRDESEDKDQDESEDKEGSGGHSHGESGEKCTCKSSPLPYNGLGSHDAWGENNHVGTLIQNAIEQAIREKGDLAWGSMSGTSISAIKAAQETEVRWEKELRFQLGRNISMQRMKTQSKPNRRGVPYHTYQGTKRKYIDRILVAIDTSGSVSDDELAKFLAEINAMVKRGIPVDLMLFDHGLQWERARPFRKAAVEFDFEGRGGTEFSAPIKYAEENRYKTLVMFTDGGASDPGEPDNLDVLWVITPPPGSCPPPEWGKDRYVQMTLPPTAAVAV